MATTEVANLIDLDRLEQAAKTCVEVPDSMGAFEDFVDAFDARTALILIEIAKAASELVSPAGMVNRGLGVGLVVVEKADRSDPHYRLCTALALLNLFLTAKS